MDRWVKHYVTLEVEGIRGDARRRQYRH